MKCTQCLFEGQHSLQFNDRDKLVPTCAGCGSFIQDQLTIQELPELPSLYLQAVSTRTEDRLNSVRDKIDITVTIRERLVSLEAEIAKRRGFEGEARKLKKMLKAAEKEEARAAKHNKAQRDGVKSETATLKN